MHIHLDPVGGVAGDMFVAAMIDAWPSLAPLVADALDRIDLPAGVVALPVGHDDGSLSGHRFDVQAGPADQHPHRSFRSVKALLEGSGLSEIVRDRARDVFSHLAEAESRVHGVAVDDVEFHEVGAWDSIVDVVAAAAAIEASGATSWSVGPLPLGAGMVETAHGRLPVPAPATVVLLEGLPVVDDGLPGERVTPTGAAILRSLAPSSTRPMSPQRLGVSGTGFGTRLLPDRPNILRVIELVPDLVGSGDGTLTADSVGVVEFDVDDQTAEDLAVGLDRLRERPGVLDVIQRVGYGKKGRLVTEVRVLCDREVLDAVVRSCLSETTTLGVRWGISSRTVLDRAETHSGGMQVKTAIRPDGRRSVKVEMDELAEAGDRLAREDRRRLAEAVADDSPQ